MKNVSMKIGFVVIFAAAVLAGCSGKKTAAGGHEKVTIKFPTASASGALYAVEPRSRMCGTRRSIL